MAMSADQTTSTALDGRDQTTWRSDLHRTEEKSAPKLARELHLTPINAGGGFSGSTSISRAGASGAFQGGLGFVRKRNDDEDAKEELYSLVTVTEIPAEGLRGLGTKAIEDED